MNLVISQDIVSIHTIHFNFFIQDKTKKYNLRRIYFSFLKTHKRDMYKFKKKCVIILHWQLQNHAQSNLKRSKYMENFIMFINWKASNFKISINPKLIKQSTTHPDLSCSFLKREIDKPCH